MEGKSFRRSKELLLSTQVLVHFDPKRPLVLSCDAPKYGIGAVLSQTMEDGAEKPVAFASRSLNQAEKGTVRLRRKAWLAFWGNKIPYVSIWAYFSVDHRSQIVDNVDQ